MVVGQGGQLVARSSRMGCDLRSGRELTVKDFLEALDEVTRDMGNVHVPSRRDRIRNWIRRVFDVLPSRRKPAPEPLAPLPQRIHGRKFLEHLGDLGVIKKADLERGQASDYVCRVIIEAPISGPVMLYVERYGDERLLEVRWTELGFDYHETHR